MGARFTIDGSAELERRIEVLCDRVLEGVLKLLSRRRLRALVLGGGYGRGHGGVLRCEHGDEPYNDLEFYVFLRGNRLLNLQRHRRALDHLAESLSRGAGLHVEFKMDALDRFRRMPISMFSYDLLAGHRILFGGGDVFSGCEHHLLAESIPVSEATRLLFNRCTGLLLVREMLMRPSLDAGNLDFIQRNIAKAQLALGDALLAADGRYHWDVRERHRRLVSWAHDSDAMDQIATDPACLDFDEVIENHAAGLRFKLRPVPAPLSTAEPSKAYARVASLAREVWLFLESRRLNRRFVSTGEYAASNVPKWDNCRLWTNYLLNLRTFGLRAALDPAAGRYPRERLLTALPVLLWGDTTGTPKNLQRLLYARSADWQNLVAAYKEVWPSYG